MTLRKIVSLLIIITATLLTTPLAFAQDKIPGHITEYSALYTERDSSGEKTIKVYVARNMTRQDFNNGEEIIVTRYDRGEIYIIYPKLHIYLIEKYNGEAPLFDTSPREGTFGDMTREFVGHETKDTYRLKKYLVTIDFRGNSDNRYQYYEWYRDNFPLPIKTASLKGFSETEYTHIKLRTPKIDLFSRPTHGKQVDRTELETILLVQKDREK